MEDLSKVDFQKTFVLDWKHEGKDLVFDLDICLLPTHPDYSQPKENEVGYYIKGRLRFEAPSMITGLKNKEETMHSKDPDGNIDYGEIEAIAINTCGDWSICGDFGDVVISQSNLHLEINKNEG